MAPPQVLESFRADQRRPVVWALATGAILVSAGSLLVALSLILHLFWIKAVALVVVASGALLTVLRLRRLLRDSTAIVVRTDGIAIHHPEGAEELVPWEELSRVTHEPARGCVVLHRIAGAPLEIPFPLPGIPAEELARRLDRWRQREGLGLL